MASRKSRNIYISKYFMAVRNCINIFILCELKICLCWPVSTSANCVIAGNLDARIKPSSYLFSFFQGLCFRFEFKKKKSNVQSLG